MIYPKVPLDYYQLWQMEKYGNILPATEADDNPDDLQQVFGHEAQIFNEENGIQHDSRFDGTNDLEGVL